MASVSLKNTPQKKDTPGLLMSIIRTLSSGANVKKREEEKARLEKAYKESDKKLDKLVHEHMTDLTSVMQAFSTISSQIKSSQERIRAIKENVQSCKNLLHCKRDELRKLWIEGIEHKTAVDMLDQIEQVKDVIGKLQAYIDKKHYLHATELLVLSVALLEGDLAEVEALKDVKVELLAKKEELYELLVQELHRQIYIKSTSTVVKGFQRQGSLRHSTRGDRNITLSKPTVALQLTEADLLAEENLKRLKNVNLEQVATPQQVHEDANSNPEDDVVKFFMLLIESLATLNKLPDAVKALRSHIRPGLLAIVQRSSLQVADSAYLEGETISQVQQPHFLLELLELIFEQFCVVACTHQVVLANMRRIQVINTADIVLYEISEVWVQIQAVLELLLGDYLDIRNSSSSSSSSQDGQQGTAFEEPATEIRNYFQKKRPAKPKKFALFRFDASSHAISMSSYLREQRQEFYGSGEVLSSMDNNEVGTMQFVCKACTSNITVIYNSLQKFITEIETAINCAPGSCGLQVFVTNFIRNMYLGQVFYNTQATIDAATKGFDSQRTVIDLRTQQELGTPKPLLKGTVAVAKSIEELCRLMQDLPHYAEQFLNMICKILHDYRDTCHNSYKSIVQSDAEDKGIISATWSKDEDINRFLRCLPNWRGVKEENAAAQQMTEEDLRAMNAKESAILTANLSTDQPLAESEIINDIIQLGSLANLCESLDWFSKQIDMLVRSLGSGRPVMVTTAGQSQKTQQPQQLAKVSEKTLKVVSELSADFQDLSEVCLLVLHLEVRVHCFYYLIPLTKQHASYCNAIDDMDPDFYVIKLNKDLTSIEDMLQQSLQLKRLKYIFEGLGHLVSSILINSTQYLKRINENGIKKMCRNIFSVQQSLTNITLSREADLDHAKQYYELLYLTPDEILKALVARGPQFSEQQYGSLLTLAYRSERGTGSHSLSQLLKTLEEILTEYDSIV